jgi:predicted N-formylglutamate amidohydrolase
LEHVTGRMLQQERFLLHIAVHSFPCFRQGKPKRADVGLLYDPACLPERNFCLDWAEEIYYEIPIVRIRRNYPGRGTADRLTRSLRQRLHSPRYLGIELQLNQAWAARPVAIRDQTFARLAESLRAIIEHSLPQHAEAA